MLFDYGMALDQYYFANIWRMKDKLFKKRDLEELKRQKSVSTLRFQRTVKERRDHRRDPYRCSSSYDPEADQ